MDAKKIKDIDYAITHPRQKIKFPFKFLGFIHQEEELIPVHPFIQKSASRAQVEGQVHQDYQLSQDHQHQRGGERR